MSSVAPLLLEIGCEEIPARMIPDAAEELGRRVLEILDVAELAHGEARCWGGSRRLAVRVEGVTAQQPDRHERVLGPPAEVALDADGAPTRAAVGFAKKQGIDPDRLTTLTTDKGLYVGFERIVAGRAVGQVLAGALPQAVAGMSFPKTMRWADGGPRWVRPVHWVLALHGEQLLPVELFGVRAASASRGHRFKSSGPVKIDHPDRYAERLHDAFVLADPAERRARLAEDLDRAAQAEQGCLVNDPQLLERVADLVEWPGVVAGRVAPRYLDLPRDLLITTLRHHQNCFSVQSAAGELLPVFLAVANTDVDPIGHIRRGNEWVVGGRLEDARFFWNEDRKRTLESRSADLGRVVFHAKLDSSYADKAARLEALADAIANEVGLSTQERADSRCAARWAKNDLVTGTVGEFPELQGRVGGLLLLAEEQPEAVARGVYSHYQPEGPEDPIPPDTVACVVSIADKLDSIAQLIRAGETPTGSRDPFGLRRAASGMFRVIIERLWPLSLDDLRRLASGDETLSGFLRDRLVNFLREAGWTSNEVLAVMRPRVSPTDALGWPLHDVTARLDAIQRVRGREDFRGLVKLTERVNNILTKNSDKVRTLRSADPSRCYAESQQAASALGQMVDQSTPEMASQSDRRCYDEIVRILSEFIDPVERFFVDVLVIDESNPAATCYRYDLLVRLSDLLTRYFDIRELAGQAKRRS
jgi:glycyl-tRNA synthetase beta chain